MYSLYANEILGKHFKGINSFHSESSEVISFNIGGGSQIEILSNSGKCVDKESTHQHCNCKGINCQILVP